MGAIAGPLIGLFLLGAFVTKASKHGAFIGIVTSSAITLSLLGGGFYFEPFSGYRLPTNTSCHHIDYNLTAVSRTNPGHYGKESVWLVDLIVVFYYCTQFRLFRYPFRISNYLYPFIGIVLTVVVGSVASLIMPDPKTTAARHQRRMALTYWGRDIPFDKNDISSKDQCNKEMPILSVVAI